MKNKRWADIRIDLSRDAECGDQNALKEVGSEAGHA